MQAEPLAPKKGVERNHSGMVSEPVDGALDRRVNSQGRNSALKREGTKWTRLTHVYVSMIALALVLFFGVTGITLNHPDWTFGFDPTMTQTQDTLPDGIVDDTGTINSLALSEFLRSQQGVTGTVTDYQQSDNTAFISYRGPGYAADADIDAAAGTFDLRVEQQGLMAVLNDIHKGRNTADGWNWVIDVSGGFLVAIALTGLGLQLFLKKRRTTAIVIASICGLIAIVLAWRTVI
jgi:hypothetical protein